MSEDGIIHTLRLSEREIEALIDRLNAPQSRDDESKRFTRRWPLEVQRNVAVIYPGEGARRDFVVIPRNISTGGLAFIHGSFIYPGTRCVIIMRDTAGRARAIPSTIVRCELVKGAIHDIGVQFEKMLDPREFSIRSDGGPFLNAERVDAAELRGHIVVADAGTGNRAEFARVLKGTKIDSEFVTDSGAAMAMLERGTDLLLLDVSLADRSPIEFVSAARSNGIATPIVITGAAIDEALRMKVLQAGADEILVKPITADLLIRALAEFIVLRGGAITPERPAISAEPPTATEDGSRGDTTPPTVRRAVEAIGQALAKQDLELVRAQIGVLRLAAQSSALSEIAARADGITAVLSNCASLESVRAEIDALIKICGDALEGEDHS